MRVLAFCDYYSPDSCGGAERVAREVYRRLAAEHGADVTVVGTGASGRATQRVERLGAGRIREISVPGLDLSRRLGVQLTVSPRLSRAVRNRIRASDPTVLHANSLHFHGTVVAARIARRTGIPLVTTAHLGGVELLPLRMRLGARAWDQTFGRSIVAASSHLIAVSNSVAAHLHQLGARGGQTSVVYNGVDHEVFHPRGRTTGGGPLRVGFVGRLIANKGPHLLLQALATVHAAGLAVSATFIGDGPMRGELQARAGALGLAEVVTFTGHVRDVAPKLRALDVVVRPSFTEGLPLGVIEAMACGAVTVCSDVPGNLELINDGETGVVFPVGDAPALAAALTRIGADRGCLMDLREKALARAMAFSWDASAKQHFQLLQTASSRGRSA